MKSVIWMREEFIGPQRPGESEFGFREVSDDELAAVTKGRLFIGYGKEANVRASLLVQYASMSKAGGLMPGYGSFE